MHTNHQMVKFLAEERISRFQHEAVAWQLSRQRQTKNPGQQILLERQGTMWEGSGKKELPAWMTGQEADARKRASIRRNPLMRVGRLLAAVLGVKS